MVKVLDFNYFCRHGVPYILHLLLVWRVFAHNMLYNMFWRICLYLWKKNSNFAGEKIDYSIKDGVK